MILIKTEVCAYLVMINMWTFVLFAHDKALTRKGREVRVSERSLLAISLIGGSPAALVAMKLLRHKTVKSSFRARMAIVIAIQLLAIAAGVYAYNR